MMGGLISYDDFTDNVVAHDKNDIKYAPQFFVLIGGNSQRGGVEHS